MSGPTPAGLPQCGGLTAQQVVMVLQSIASAAATLRQFAGQALESNDAEELSTSMWTVQLMATHIGAVADQASGSQCVGDLMSWVCGPAFAEAGAKGGAS